MSAREDPATSGLHPPEGQRFRLIGVGLHNFRDPEEEAAQPELFEGEPPVAE